ncbi:hypothetical protein N473_21790 [Pseudoalteromonas luteoviolacea CPMOR-1]|uniref:Threonine transporter RhtB n=1 Tax=Pseudoalteromonas luteoviolacea CPMOR-1 TaxID=1365248 RepID=A0A167JXS6_9GAMM|nr:LysE family translocator [Pseudoalteromonas luteoviolacea]KZN61823.1 hypothetical protein N473_21790 [Pseudoalteromonas luteoviolacea CPMOR-1]
MDITTWVLFCVAELILCISPGPAVFYVVSHGVSSGFKASILAALGVVGGSAIYFLISATGINTMLSSSDTFFLFVKWAGAAYLLWIGINLFLEKRDPNKVQGLNSVSAHKAFKGGLFIELSNPKTLLFFVAVLPQFIDDSKPFLPQLLILGLTSIVIELLCLLLYAQLSSKVNEKVTSESVTVVMNKLSAVMLISIGVSLTLMSK